MNLRVVLDTNVIVSGFGWGGVPSQVLDAAFDGRFVVVTSIALLHDEGLLEDHRVGSYHRIPAASVQQLPEGAPRRSRDAPRGPRRSACRGST